MICQPNILKESHISYNKKSKQLSEDETAFFLMKLTKSHQIKASINKTEFAIKFKFKFINTYQYSISAVIRIRMSLKLFWFALLLGLFILTSSLNHNQDAKPVKSDLKSDLKITKAKDGDCYSPRFVTEQGVCACPDRKNYVPERNECVCPKYAPFWNGQYCSGCPPGMDFNLDLGICYVCPEGFVRGYKTMTCMPGLIPSSPKNNTKADVLPADKVSHKH